MNKNGKHGAKYGTKEKETKKFFGRISFRAFALSLVALIQIALLLVGATYSWVETISSIKFDGATGKIGTGVNKIVKLTDTAGEVSLDNYFEQVGGGTHLAACSSADAKNFYFPIVGVVDKDNKDNKDNKRYRHGTINDKNVNYIDFDFQIKNTTTTEKSFRFDGVPDVPENVRIAIWAEGDSPKILAKVDEATTKPVVSSTSSGTTESTVQPLKNYTAEKYSPDNETNDSTIFKIGSGKTATVYIKLWLQQDINSTTESANDVVIENFKLASYTSQKKISVALGTGVKGGSVNINGTGNGSSIIANYGDTVKLVATANDLTYEFTGWYDNAECSGNPVSTNATYSITVGDDTSAKYYAKFEEKKTITVHIKNYPQNWSEVHAYMCVGSKDNTWHGTKMEKNNATNEYELEIKLSDNYNKIIFNKGNNDDNSQSPELSIPSVGSKEICYDYSTKKWCEHAETPTTTTTPPTTTPSTYTIYLTNNKNWQNPYCYAWNNVNSRENAERPGVAMTDTGETNGYGEKIYKIVISSEYTRLIFSDKGSSATSEVNIEKFSAGTAYYIKDDNTVGTWTYNPQ